MKARADHLILVVGGRLLKTGGLSPNVAVPDVRIGPGLDCLWCERFVTALVRNRDKESQERELIRE